MTPTPDPPATETRSPRDERAGAAYARVRGPVGTARAAPRRRLHEHLVLEVAREIVSGRLPEAAELPAEQELADRFGVSKPVARETVQALAGSGLVLVQHGKRATVRDESEWDVLFPSVSEAFALEGRGDELKEQFYETRALLEVGAATAAAERATPKDVELLRRLTSEMHEIATGPRDLRLFLAVDARFHDAVTIAGSNRVTRHVLRRIHEYLADNWSNSKITPDELSLLSDQHARIAAAIEQRDADGAARAMADHLAWAQRVERNG